MWGDLVVGENGVALASTYLGGHQRMVTPLGPGGYSIGSPSFYDSDVDVTSMVAEHGGSFVTSFSSGAMLGSDDGYAAMPLAYASYVGENTWVGFDSGSPSPTAGRLLELPTGTSGIVGVFGPALTVALSPWPHDGGDGKESLAAQNNEMHIFLQFKTDWDAALKGDGLSDAERTALQRTARTALEDAFPGYAVKAVLDTGETVRLNKYNRRVTVDGLDTGANGETVTGPLTSSVHMATLFRSFKSAVDCGGGMDCRAAPFDDISHRPGVTRTQLLSALGRGIGATAAHEVGHQDNVFVGVRPFTAHTTTCGNCYDYTPANPAASYPHEYFFGPLHWSEAAQKAMRATLPPKV
jgi:hypothetical protein